MERLPIDEHLSEIARMLMQGHLVIEAEPGAGKTTRVPPALLDSRPGEIWVTEPRRLAARMAAGRVASELGEAVGQRVGYQVRFDKKVSGATRVRFVTEGILLRRLASDPDLKGIGTVLFDEFHERNLDGDVGLALCRGISERREDFRIVVMSATLAAGPVMEFLPGCQRVRVAGRQYPVTVSYDTRYVDRPLEVRVRAAVRAGLSASDRGHVLVFVPGLFEIGKCIKALGEFDLGAELLPLHGGLPPREQDRAVRASPGRKVIVATNVAESSVTIDGVELVVDSGLVRTAGHSPWSGLSVFRTVPASRAAAEQRAGRAGRTGPGRAIRLFSENEFSDRTPQPVPEILTADLSVVALQLAASNVVPESFDWFEPPRAAALQAAMTLLETLGAIKDRTITDIGKRMAGLPLHPRLARLVVAGESLGVGRDALIAAALLSDGDGRWRRHRGPAEIVGESDVAHAVERFEIRDVDGRTRKAVDTVVGRLGRGLSDGSNLSEEEREQRLGRAVLAGFPDRVARRRDRDKLSLILYSGQTAAVDPGSIVSAAPLVVVVDAEERHGRARARLLSAFESDWLLEAHLDLVRDERTLVFDPVRERVDAVSRLTMGAVVLEESRRPPVETDGKEIAAVLARAVAGAPKGLGAFVDMDALRLLVYRVAFAREHYPDRELPALSMEDAATSLLAECEGATSFAELRELDILAVLRARIEGGQWLGKAVPLHIELLGGRRLQVHYEPGKPPWVASRLQDFFGMTKTPTIAEGRVPLTLHILAPNKRALQVTSDLASFWEAHYPSLRKQLSRRYARHAWPDDPTKLQPAMKPRKPRRK